MPTNTPDINSMSSAERKQYIENEIRRFEILFMELKQENYTLMSPQIKYLQEEIFATHSIAGCLTRDLRADFDIFNQTH